MSEQQADLVAAEYCELECVPPGGHPDLQHEGMVREKLCKRACENDMRNRYCNLYPFDTQLFRFNDHKQYINASWIDFGTTRKYVVTMAPMHPSLYENSTDITDTCVDFWMMCWQAHARDIVMLCNVEREFTGCSRYFPLQEGDEDIHASFTIRNKRTMMHADFVERHLDITSGAETRSIRHLQFTGWPNYGLPDDVQAIARFIRLIRTRCDEGRSELVDEMPELMKPPYFILHCSGGVGRSGTLLAAYEMFCQLQSSLHSPTIEICTLKDAKQVNTDNRSNANSEYPTTLSNGEHHKDQHISADLHNTRDYIREHISLKGLVLTMRKQRHPWMVEGLAQYRFAYDVLSALLLHSQVSECHQ